LGQRKGKELVGEPDDVGCTGDAQVSIPIPDTEADSTTELDEEEAIQMQITLHNILMESAGSSSIESKAEQSWSSWNSISRVWRASAETERSERRVGAGALAKYVAVQRLASLSGESLKGFIRTRAPEEATSAVKSSNIRREAAARFLQGAAYV
jgi:hypothetical protein